jgi:HPt (histidine-containing phosphotransfer) domain-containing protein
MTENPNFSYFDTVTGGNYETMMEFIEIFKEQLPEFIANFNNALAQKDYKMVAYTAHKATSSVSVFGMTFWAEKLKEIQTKIQNEQVPGNMEEIIALFEKESKETIEIAIHYAEKFK